jgi:hypothetical protein
MLQAQATAISYVDAYWVFTFGSAIMVFLPFMMQENRLGKSEQMTVL